MNKLQWEEPKVIDLAVAETKNGYCDGITPDDWIHLEGSPYEHPHFS